MTIGEHSLGNPEANHRPMAGAGLAGDPQAQELSEKLRQIEQEKWQAEARRRDKERELWIVLDLASRVAAGYAPDPDLTTLAVAEEAYRVAEELYKIHKSSLQRIENE